MTGENKVSCQEESEKRRQTVAALGFAFVCLVIGLPLWWHTTQVYRVQLPYEAIGQLYQSTVEQTVHITVTVFDERLDGESLVSLKDQLKQALRDAGSNGDTVLILYTIQFLRADSAQLEIFNRANSIEDFDRWLDSLTDVEDVGQYTIVLLPEGSLLQATSVMATKRTAYARMHADVSITVSLIRHIVRDLLVNEAAIRNAFVSARGARKMQPDKESMRALRSHASYDITFSLLNPQADILRVHWDIKGAIADYLDRLLESFDEYITFTVKSQYVHCTDIGVRPTFDESADYFRLSQKDLPRVINAIEPYLASHVSNNPHLNFIVYVPSRSQSPLQICDDNGKGSETNAFLSPRWGGVLVYNVPLPANSSLPHDVSVDSRRMMRVFASQLRLLLGINPQVHDSDVAIWSPGNAIVSEWEVDAWLRSRCMENIGTASATLHSLAQLLEQIGNIVINDDIGNEVHKAVSYIDTCKQHLKLGKLRDAFLTSKQAVISSEKAFFDPSLLELLYFPEDQKFAIYIPLFLPVSIPIIMSLIQAAKWFRSKEKTS